MQAIRLCGAQRWLTGLKRMLYDVPRLSTLPSGVFMLTVIGGAGGFTVLSTRADLDVAISASSVLGGRDAGLVLGHCAT